MASRMKTAACSSLLRSLLGLALGAALLGGCSKGGSDAEVPEVPADLAVPAPRPDLAMAPRRLLRSFSGCPAAMFDKVQLEDDFDSQASLDASWDWKNDGRFPTPRLVGGAMVFGPHNLDPSEWWNNWSPLQSLAPFGDAMLCVRYRIKPPGGLLQDDNVFNVWFRGGMTVVVAPLRNRVLLNTRTSDTTWDEHGSAPMMFKPDVEQTLEIAIYGKGSRYYAEARNLDTGELVALAVTYDKLPAQAAVGMLAWRIKNPVYLDRAIVGTPSQEAAAILADK